MFAGWNEHEQVELHLIAVAPGANNGLDAAQLRAPHCNTDKISMSLTDDISVLVDMTYLLAKQC